MKSKLLLSLLLLSALQVFSQEKKWSIEANYSVIPANGFGGKDDIIDVGLKYRFADFNFLNICIGINGGFSNENYSDSFIEGRLNTFYIQPRLFSELTIPGIKKLRPSLGLGYSIVDSDSSFISNGEDRSYVTTNGGFNFNMGVTYDVTKHFFIQAQYDFINLNNNDEFSVNGVTYRPDFTEKLNTLRIGVGFRF